MAQGFVFNIKQYDIEDGLSHRNVHFAIQDQQGLMWFGSDYGLNRFDGYHFKWITKEKHGLQSNQIQKALEDKDGLLWLLYGETKVFGDRSPDIFGIDIFNPITEQIQTFEDYFKEKSPYQSVDFHSFTKKTNGELVFLTKKMQLVTYSHSGTFSTVDLKKNYEGITNFHWSKNGYFWMGVVKSNYQLFIIAINAAGEEIHSLPIDLPYYNVFSIPSQDNQNEKWIATFQDRQYKFYEVTPQGQFVQDQASNQFRNHDLDFSYFGAIAGWKDIGNYVLFFSNDGFVLFDKKNNQYQRLDDQYPDIRYASNIFLARQGKIWVATQFGIFFITIKPNLFKKILHRENGLWPVRGLSVDDNNVLWIVEESIPNLWKVSLNTNKNAVLNIEQANNLNAGERLPFGDMFYALGMTESGDIMFCPGRKSFVKFNPNNYDFEHHIIPDTFYYGGSIWSLFEEKEGKAWLGTNSGFIINFENDIFNYMPLLDVPKSPSHIYQFIEAEQHIWIITEAGLFLLDKLSNQITERYWSGGEGKLKLPFDKLYHVYRENETSLWLGTAGNGLVLFNPQNGEYKQFTKSDGLSNNTIYAVYPDEYDNLWLTSDYGIMRFNKTTNQVNTYLTKDGITHNEFNRISHHQSKDGTLFFGGLNGVTSFHPKDFQTDTLISKAPLIVSNFQQFIGSENKLIDKTNDLLKENKIVLAPNDPFFRLEFALLTYEDVDKNQYAYKIDGIDQDWYYQKENYLRMNRLQYGSHILRIKGQGSNGQWSENELSISLEILKPFYLKTWFILLTAFSIIAGAFSIFKWRTSQLKKQKKLLEEEVARRTETIRKQAEELKSLEQLKSRFFANVSHELRTPLTLMLGPVNSLLKRVGKNETNIKLLQYIKQNGMQLMKLINEILQLSKLEDNKLDVIEEPVVFLNYLTEQTAQFHSFSTSEQVHFEVELNTSPDLVLLIDKNKFEKIIHNFLSNALKFTPPEGLVQLNVEEREQTICIEVNDTGSGIHPNDLPHVFDRFYQSKQPDAPTQGGTGIGLSLCRELAELLGGKVWVESELGKGSSFYFEFPKKVEDNAIIASDEHDISINDTTDFASQTRKESTTVETISSKPAVKFSQVSGKANILIVEDNNDLREYLQFLLADFHVITAENGKKGLEKLEEYSNCQLIISDLMMPVMNGFEFLEKVKADDRWRHLPFIMLTAKVNARAKLNALRVGVDDYLTKPFEEEELIVRIENLLRNYDERVAMASIIDENNGPGKSNEAEQNQPVIADFDSKWLEEVEAIFSKILADSQFTMDWVARESGLSVRQFSRRLKQLTGLTPNSYLREMRLQTARDYLNQGKYATIKETGYAVGFSDTKYFSRLFQQRFGISPSVYLSTEVMK